MYQSEITDYGTQALNFLQERMMILFWDNVPKELTEFSVCHSPREVQENMKVGDLIFIGDHRYEITAIGERANETFRTMGHCTLRFDGKSQVDLPGEIQLSGTPIYEIQIGQKIEIIYR